MNKKTFSILILLSIFLSLFMTSCEKNEEDVFDIKLPPAPLVTESESWAVINSSYLRLRERPEAESNLVTTLWKGYVLEIESRSPEEVVVDDVENYWYRVSYDGLHGWVFGAYLEIFDSREEAEIRARAIRA